MKKKNYQVLLAAAALTVATMGACSAKTAPERGMPADAGNETAQTTTSQNETGSAVSGDSVSENTVSGDGTQTAENKKTEEVSLRDMYSSLLQKLADEEELINAYDWKGEYYYYEGQWEPGDYGDKKIAAVGDVTGDGLEDLVYVTAYGDAYRGQYPSAAIRIYSWEKGEMQMVFEQEEVDYNAGGGFGFWLMTGSEPGSLLLVRDVGEDLSEMHYSNLVWNGETFEVTREMTDLIAWDDSASNNEAQTVETFTVDGEDCSGEEFGKLKEAFYSDVDRVLLFNRVPEEELTKKAAGEDYVGLPMSEAKATLQVAFSHADGEAADEAEVFEKMAGDYIMSSGVGAWAAEFELKKDGSFTASYYDQNLGESGKGYDATMYLSNAEGSFTDVVKTGDHRYVARVSELSYEKEPGTEEIESVENIKMRNAYTSMSGLVEGHYVEFYMPEIPLEELSEAFLFWDLSLMYSDSKPTKLGKCGVYDPVTELGYVQSGE